MVISVYNWDLLQVWLCDVVYFCSVDVDFSLSIIEILYGTYRFNQVVLFILG